MNKLTPLFLLAGLALAAPAQGAMINEFVANDIGTDDYEFVELCGNPGESLDGLWLVLIEGEGSGAGVIDAAIALSGYVIGSNGHFVIGGTNVSPDLPMANGWIENGGNNILLVRDFNGAVGQDIDTDNDCVADLGIGVIVDGVGYGLTGDCMNYYGITSIGPDGTFSPAGGARCEDCNPSGAWYIICLNGTEPTGPGCLESSGYLIPRASPGAINLCGPVPAESASWGALKSTFR